MKCIRNNSGFTLIELIIIIGVISVMVSSVGYSLNAVFVSELDGVSNEITNTLRDVRVEQMGSVNEQFTFEFKKETDGYYYYVKEGSTIIRSVKINGRLKVYKIVSGVNKDIGTLTATDLSIQFNKAIGSITSDGAGDYVLEHDRTGETVVISINKTTGGGRVEK